MIALAASSVLAANSGYAVYQDYHVTITDHEAMLTDLAAVVAEQARRSVEDSDLVLHQIDEEVRSEGGLAAIGNDEQHWKHIKRISDRVRSKVSILLADTTGNVVIDSEAFPTPDINLSDRDYMQVLAKRDVLYIGPAVVSKVNSNAIIYTIDRRLTDGQGNFTGVASVGISTSHLTGFYDLMSFRKDPLIVICRVNGDIIARRPNVRGLVGANLSNTKLFREYIPSSQTGIHEIHSPLDGIDRLAAWKVIPDYGLVVMVGIAHETIFSEWWGRLERTGAITLASIALILLSAWGGTLTVKRAARVQAKLDLALREKMLADTALDSARHDHLTKLPGRALFLEMAERLSERGAVDGAWTATLLVDLDGFKKVNDSYGHSIGDTVLVKAADVLRSCVREGDLAARLGGDEFVLCILAPEEAIRERASALAQRVVERMCQIGMGIGCSVGVAMSPASADATTVDMKKADDAMYEAKRRGKNQFVVWEAAHDASQPTE